MGQKKSSIIQNIPQQVIKPNVELQKVYTILDSDNISPIQNNFSRPTRNNNSTAKKGLVKKKAEDKKIVINSKTFEGQNFDV